MVIDTPEESEVTQSASSAAPVAAAPGAVACVKRVMRKSLNRELSPEQAATLWLECRALMLKEWSCRKVVREIEEPNESGGLDTYPREYLMDAIAMVLAGTGWPANMTPQAESDAFAEAMKASFAARGYARNILED